jgi:hypothetical protein
MSSSLLDLALGVAPDLALDHDSDARRVSLSASARLSLSSTAEAGEGRGGRDSLVFLGDGGGRVSDVGNGAGAGAGAAPVSMLEALRARTDDERPMVCSLVPARITPVRITVRTAVPALAPEPSPHTP